MNLPSRAVAIAALLALPLTAAACGDDDSAADQVESVAETTTPVTAAESVPETSPAPTTEPTPQTTEPVATTEPAPATTESATTAAAADDAAQVASDTWTLVFDSTVPFADKAVHIEDAAALQATVESYTTTGETMGGISLRPTASVVDGDTATITYDILFGGTAAYTAQEGHITNVDGTWVVSRDEFCGFMASARNACPAV